MRSLERISGDNVDILVVEDSPTQAEQLVHLLVEKGYRPEVAHNGAEALEALSRTGPALVLSDVVMPGMDGYELCRRIKSDERTRTLPVVLVTSLSDPSDVIRGLECGADNFIVKPYRADELLSRIEFILANRRLPDDAKAEMPVEILFAGRRHVISAHRHQILNLLLATYDTAVRRNRELAEARDQLAELAGHLEEKVRERTAELEAEIAERKRAEEVLAESERRYRLLYDRNLSGLFRMTLGGEMLQCNDAFARILGYGGREEIMLVNARRFHFEASEREALLEQLRRKGRLTGWEQKLRRKDGSLVWVEGNLTLVDEEGRDQPVVEGTMMDVTERKSLEDQLRHAQKMESIGSLAGGVAHDFNNVLQALLSLTQVLRAHRGEPERFAATLEELEQHIRRGAALTRQLLLFSRREVSLPEPLDLGEVIQGVAKLLRRLVRENVSMTVEAAAEPLPIHADRGQLEQVLVNLVVNAGDAMPDGGKVEVRCGRGGEHEVWFEVADTGGGISEDALGKIFDPFFTTKAPGKGTGLGLSVVHGIVTRHGGRIEVASGVGKGSTFRVFLPRAGSGAHPAASAELVKAGELPQGRGERVLIVEDEEGTRASLRDILATLGYEVHAVGSGEEAGLLPAAPAYDVLLTDLVLPGIHGPDLARGLCARWPGLKVILMSGYTEDEALRRGVTEGQARFLQKPFDMETLARTLRAAIAEA